MNRLLFFGPQCGRHVLGLLLLVVAGLGGGVGAQEADPPGRAGRLADVEGQIWLYTPDSTEWTAAVRNQPIATGDRLATEAGARAELQVGSTTLRFDSSSEFEVTRLDDARFALSLRDGSVWIRVRDIGAAGQLDVTTDEGRFIALQAGVYRIDRRAGRSDLTVLAGQARYDGRSSALAVEAGQRAQFFIDAGGVAQYSLLTPASDVFASWNGDRDRRSAVAVAAERYVSPEMTGAAELDRYGRWEADPENGSVWVPTAVAADWAPYTAGHWTYVQPWGWNWVDDAPWGFAPFHYGRWLYARNRWCWTPGARVARPVYAPALVAWAGGPPRGGRFGGGPPVGWLPLAPREVYVPGYRVSRGYARNLNAASVTNVTVVDNVFANPERPREFGNRLAPRAFTVVPPEVLNGRHPVGPAAAQYRQTPGMREWTTRPGGFAPLLAPPVALPPRRSADARDFVPPDTPGRFRPDARPGDRPAGFEAGPGDRRGGPDQQGPDRRVSDPRIPDQRGPDPRIPDQRLPDSRPPGVIDRPGERPAFDGRPVDRPAWPGRGSDRPAGLAPQSGQPIGVAPLPQPVTRPPIGTAPVNPSNPQVGGARAGQEAPTMQPFPVRRPEEPTMRPFPVRRDDERRSGGEERRSQPQADAVRNAPPTPAAPPIVMAPVAPAAPARQPVAPPPLIEQRTPPPRVLDAPRPVEAARPNVPPPQVQPQPQMAPPRGEGRPVRDDSRRGDSQR